MRGLGHADINDYFAGQALAGLVVKHPFEYVAAMAYEQADAMLAERDKGEG